MDIRCAEAGAAPVRAAAVRSLSAVLLFAALYGAALSLAGLALRWLPCLAGAACAALMPLMRGAKGPRLPVHALMAAALAAGLALVQPVRVGAGMACNALFSASEAVNRYVYTPVVLPPDADAALCRAAFGCWLALAAAFAAGVVSGSATAWCPFLAASVAVAVQVYFGVVPAVWVQLLLFGCLGAMAVRRMTPGASWRDAAAAAAVLLALGLAVGLLLPGVHPALEARSERLRDWLSTQWPGGATVASSEERSVNLLRQESLLTQQAAGTLPDDAQEARGYERRQVFRRDISAPRPVDYVRIVLLLLLVVAVLVGPFLPFLWLDRQKRRAAARRADFASDNPAGAIAAMFQHIARCLVACGARPDSRGFAALCGQEIPGLTQEYWADYRAGALLWQEAAYSGHAMSEAQREQMAALLRRTEQLVYGAADRRLRFRLQYIDCLILAEELE